MKKKIFTFVTLLVFVISCSVTTFANEMYPPELMIIIEQSQQITTNDGKIYNLVLIPAEDEERFMELYNDYSKKTRDILPNLVRFSYSTTYNSFFLKATNIAVDSLDFLYGYVCLINDTGDCGRGDFSFYNIPPMGSEYVKITTYGGGSWDSGFFFADAADGSVTNNGVFYFNRIFLVYMFLIFLFLFLGNLLSLYLYNLYILKVYFLIIYFLFL